MILLILLLIMSLIIADGTINYDWTDIMKIRVFFTNLYSSVREDIKDNYINTDEKYDNISSFGNENDYFEMSIIVDLISDFNEKSEYYTSDIIIENDKVINSEDDLYVDNSQNVTAYKASHEDKRACWISFLDIEVNLCDLDERAFRIRIGEMYDNIIADNMNTVLFHVRPMCDAVYPSEYYPYSTYISSDRSNMGYDALQIAIEEAHRRNLSFEAWINPYRVSKNETTTNSFKETEFYDKYKDFIIEYYNVDGEICLSLDPAKEESIELIEEGISELLDNYDIDGIHFDDYFYVSGMSYGLSVEEKKDNINNMIKRVYALIKEKKTDCEFGISPAGNMDNARNDGADIDTWLSEDGYLDYIMPQLYWTDNFVTDDGEFVKLFSERCQNWMEINKLDKPIYTGLALYKAGEEYDNDLGWYYADDNLSAQYKNAYNMGYDGFALFRYAWLEDERSYKEIENLNNYIENIY
ncbi:MAG: family 10 glycosylhydrolase [Lachnospiraceae bacterium]|nr:family 10 glycosylhydrolase [Lachnospiraceae bacterium]